MKRLASLSGLFLLVVVGAGSAVVYAQNNNSAQKANISCDQKVGVVNFRSKILGAYKSSEDSQYKRERKKLASRIAYAGQWVPKDAEKAREKLYKYDELHKSLNTELDKQIKNYQYLETDPLDCSDAKKDLLSKKLDEINGVKDKKIVGGQALIRQKKNEQQAYVRGDLKSANDNLVKKMHKAKSKHPKPSKPVTSVKDATN